MKHICTVGEIYKFLRSSTRCPAKHTKVLTAHVVIIFHITNSAVIFHQEILGVKPITPVLTVDTPECKLCALKFCCLSKFDLAYRCRNIFFVNNTDEVVIIINISPGHRSAVFVKNTCYNTRFNSEAELCNFAVIIGSSIFNKFVSALGKILQCCVGFARTPCYAVNTGIDDLGTLAFNNHALLAEIDLIIAGNSGYCNFGAYNLIAELVYLFDLNICLFDILIEHRYNIVVRGSVFAVNACYLAVYKCECNGLCLLIIGRRLILGKDICTIGYICDNCVNTCGCPLYQLTFGTVPNGIPPICRVCAKIVNSNIITAARKLILIESDRTVRACKTETSTNYLVTELVSLLYS